MAERPGDAALWVRGLSKHYGRVRALDGLSLHIARGEIFGLLGANGAGKTTALRAICGLLRTDAGDGQRLGVPLEGPRVGLGYVTQRGALYEDLSVQENLMFHARAHNLTHAPTRVARALTEHGLQAWQRQRVGALSGGWRQRVALACAMLPAPRLLLLDEPTAGLDPQAREALWLRLRELAAGGVALLVTTHYADEAERCARIAYLAAGRLRAQGPPGQLAATLGIAAWRVADPVHAPGCAMTRDADGWRAVARRDAPAPPGAQPLPPRLGDALVWLAAEPAYER